MTPTEKHRETARKIAGIAFISGPEQDDLTDAILAAIAEAKREGMKRAAEIAREHTPIAQDNCDIRISATLEVVARAILSEAGKDE